MTLDGRPPDLGLLGRMIRRLAHRGPDGLAYCVRDNAALAHARLAIIDVEGGRQPMTNEDGTVWVTFNGEIFNYLELREGLLARGHRFRSASDTEVIVHLYEEHGDRFVEHLNGQWALAIWDARRRRLLLSRDPIGVRPLFYAATDRLFLFASEVKALLAHPSVSREIDLDALDQVFTFWSVLPPRTIFRAVRALPPAHALALEAGRSAVRRYWALDFTPASPDGLPERACAERLRELLTDATRLRLRSDVPVGAYLSGGLDSALVAALAQRTGGRRLRTFSIAFDDPAFDESAEQNAVVRCLGTDHAALRCSAADIARVFPDVIRHTETPILRTAPAPMFLLARAVRAAGFAVVLTGEGSDELLGGYDIFKETKIRAFCARRPESRLRPRLLRRLYQYDAGLRRQPDGYRAAFFTAGDSGAGDPFFSHRPRWSTTARIKMFLSDAVRAELTPSPAEAELAAALPSSFARWDRFCQAQFLECTGLLPGYLLSSQSDRVAMAHAVEGRFPFLDPRVVAFAARLPPRFKMKVLQEKHLLRMTAADLVPAAILARPKRPYQAPGASSFFPAGPIDYVEELLSPRALTRLGLFRPSAVAHLVRKCRTSPNLGNTDSMALVGILSTQLVGYLLGPCAPGWSDADAISCTQAVHH